MGRPLGLEREEALEAVDEQEALAVLEDEERVIAVEGGFRGVALEELKRDVSECDPAYRAHRAFLGGSERTWNVG